ncbi:MAG: recombinase RecA [Selenomonadaceae bacterium]|nr:recombinase RecA [Selenomonadaceae bacterium]
MEKKEKKEKQEKKVDKQAALAAAMKQIENKFGDGSIMRMGDITKIDVDSVPTGILPLDLALGVGGLPRGRIIEIYGPEAGGKTTVTLHMIASVQKQGGTAAFIDAEHALDPIYAKNLGVNLDELLVSQPNTGEEGLEIADKLISSGAVDIVVIDSVAALTPKAEIEGEMSDFSIGLHARMMSKAMRKLTAVISRTDTIAVFINQIREKVGVMYGNPETTTGGKALKFYSTIRLEVRKGEVIKKGTEIIGNRVKIKVAKNKVAPPFKTAEFDLIYGKGYSAIGGIFDGGVDLKLITRKGSFYYYEGQNIGQGRENALQFFIANPDATDYVESKIREALLSRETAFESTATESESEPVTYEEENPNE